MTTAQELAQNIGKKGLMQVSGSSLWFEVEIIDARQRYGNLDYKVRPLSGEGEQWHQASNILTQYVLKKVRYEVTVG